MTEGEPSRRRVLLAAGALAGTGLGVGRRSGAGGRPVQETPTPGETPTPAGRATPTGTPAPFRTAEADVGELVRSGDLALVVRDTDRRTLFEETAAGPFTSRLVVSMAVRNDGGTALDVGSVPPPVVRAGDGVTYEPSAAASDDLFPPGQLVPGEVARGDLVYPLPAGVADLVLLVDLRPYGAFGLDRVAVDVDDEADRVRDLQQALSVDVAPVGATVATAGVAVTLHGRRVAPVLPDGTERAARGAEFVVPEVTVANDAGEPLALPLSAVARVKDGEGRAFPVEPAAYDALEGRLETATPLSPGERRRGRIPYEVPADGRTLYWTFDFSLLGAGDKAFWRLR